MEKDFLIQGFIVSYQIYINMFVYKENKKVRSIKF